MYKYFNQSDLFNEHKPTSGHQVSQVSSWLFGLYINKKKKKQHQQFELTFIHEKSV